ncbi:hypothetical protein VOLCADRAFT_107912 [Volvox carteri f. nagariensis]|uniref:Uncharacterized protein n=1 Tax=Volvox carteri f. nagariensis TaxID=3068 RepID=D8UH65_VOLCA|nr:uncharacterized protein VOLCADRAFT_107912 [Volvox carteri f. nagariensis]EFJ40925.1 hypothetical protein VOLCADRAFT_107912 [Volvox carteri f. nagariensis]|eukprot:XP_002957992.1 hypothetical protein VOLCADRAFT_107912 [Volvox carteri f. nagariensis]
MDAAVGLEQLFAVHRDVPALAVLQQLRMDFSQQQPQELLHNHRDCLQLGRASYALCTETKVQRLCNIANISAISTIPQPAIQMALLRDLSAQPSDKALQARFSQLFQEAGIALGVGVSPSSTPLIAQAQLIGQWQQQQFLQQLHVQQQLQQFGVMMPPPPPPPPPAPSIPPAAPPPVVTYGAAPCQGVAHRGNGVYGADNSDDSDYEPHTDSGSKEDELEYDECDPRAEKKVFCTLHKQLTDFRTLVGLHFICDVLVQTDGVFKLMQAQQFKDSDVAGTIAAVQHSLRKSFIDVPPGQHTTPALKSFWQLMATTGCKSFHGHPVSNVPESPESIMHDLFKEFTENLIKYLDRRFPNSTFLSALALFNLIEYPDNVDDWGEDASEALRGYFTVRLKEKKHMHDCHPQIDFEEAKLQLSMFKHEMWKLQPAAVKDREAFLKSYVEQQQVLSQLLGCEEVFSVGDDRYEGADAAEGLMERSVSLQPSAAADNFLSFARSGNEKILGKQDGNYMYGS